MVEALHILTSFPQTGQSAGDAENTSAYLLTRGPHLSTFPAEKRFPKRVREAVLLLPEVWDAVTP
jgi:hypothetical protein